MNQKPLLGKRALIAASPSTAVKLSTAISRLGAHLIPFQAVEIRKIKIEPTLSSVLNILERYSWIIFTSSYGVRYFMEHLAECGIPAARLKGAKICAVGPSTAGAVREHGLSTHLIPDDFVAEGLLQKLSEQEGGLESLKDSWILLPRAREARDLIVRKLEAAGANVKVLPCYETLPSSVDANTIQTIWEAPPDLMVFTSSSNVTAFMSIFGGGKGKGMLQNAVVAALGPITAASIRSCGKEAEIVPIENSVPSLIESIRKHFSSK